MTNEEIIAIGAGRELDALIACRVLNAPGRFVPRVRINEEWVEQETWLADGFEPEDPPGGCYAGEAPIPYSKWIFHAWTVVEHMDRISYWCQMQTPFQPGGLYYAGFTPHATTGWNRMPDHWTGAETLPLAICRAALMAVTENEADKEV